MYKVQSIPHTADICLLLESDTMLELFHAGLEGMNQLLVHPSGKNHYFHGGDVIKISLEAIDLTALLIDFLSEVLTHTLTNRRIYKIAQVDHLSEQKLECSLTGQAVDQFVDDIKAVTYHSAHVIKGNSGKWSTRVVFDI